MPRAQQNRFSLIEMMVVIAIVLLLCTLAAGRLGKLPTAAGLEKTVRELELLFAQGAHLTTIRNRPVDLLFVPEEKTFAIDLGSSEDSNAEYLRQRYKSVTLPPEMEIDFPDLAADEKSEPVRYRCHPDANTSGPTMILKFDTRRVRLRVSPLTGQLLRQDNRRAAQ